jgi:hypothetical protein
MAPWEGKSASAGFNNKRSFFLNEAQLNLEKQAFVSTNVRHPSPKNNLFARTR